MLSLKLNCIPLCWGTMRVNKVCVMSGEIIHCDMYLFIITSHALTTCKTTDLGSWGQRSTACVGPGSGHEVKGHLTSEGLLLLRWGSVAMFTEPSGRLHLVNSWHVGKLLMVCCIIQWLTNSIQPCEQLSPCKTTKGAQVISFRLLRFNLSIVSCDENFPYWKC